MKKINLLLLFILLAVLVGCKGDNDDEFNPDKVEAEHSLFTEGFSSYVKISTNVAEEDGEIIPKYSITAFMHVLEGINREITYYQFDWVTSDNTFDTYYNREFGEPLRFIAQQFLPFVKVSGNAIDKISGLIKYKTKINDTFVKKEVKYSENIIKYNPSDYSEISNQDDVLSMNIYKFDFVDGNYHFKYQFNFKTTNEIVHLDMQSWFKTKNGDVYPLMGLYNYATKSENYLSVSDEVISGTVELDEIYIKVVYIYNNKTHVLTNIFKVEELTPLED